MLVNSITSLVVVVWTWPAAFAEPVTSVPADHALGRGVSGHPCRTPCVAGNGRCLIQLDNRELQEENCWYLQYYTARYEADKQLCIGPCSWSSSSDKLGHVCAVNATYWDWCNPNTTHEVVIEARTLVGSEPCAGACTPDTRGVHACFKRSGIYTACDPRAGYFFRAHTVFGEPCVDRCKLRGGWRSRACHRATDSDLHYCAPPARFYMRAPHPSPV